MISIAAIFFSWIFWLCYSLIALTVCRMITGHFAHSLAQGHSDYTKEHDRLLRRSVPNGSAWFVGFLGAIVPAIIWPVVLLWSLMDRKVPKIGEEKANIVAMQKSRIAQLERELEIGSHSTDIVYKYD